MQASIRLFGQGCAEDLLRLYGRPATSRELYNFMIERYGPVITFDMLQKALKKGADAGSFQAMKDSIGVGRHRRATGAYRYALL